MEEQIVFHSEDIEFEVAQPDLMRQWVAATVEQEDCDLGDVNFIFCSDEYLHGINMQYLQHDDYTDVITFPYSDECVEGDIFISLERIRENAQQFGVSAENELNRVMIHGVLHLVGYGDKTPDDKALMTEKENFYLQLLEKLSLSTKK